MARHCAKPAKQSTPLFEAKRNAFLFNENGNRDADRECERCTAWNNNKEWEGKSTRQEVMTKINCCLCVVKVSRTEGKGNQMQSLHCGPESSQISHSARSPADLWCQKGNQCCPLCIFVCVCSSPDTPGCQCLPCWRTSSYNREVCKTRPKTESCQGKQSCAILFSQFPNSADMLISLANCVFTKPKTGWKL